MPKTTTDHLTRALDLAGDPSLPPALADALTRREWFAGSRFRTAVGVPVPVADLADQLAAAPPDQLDAVLDDVAIEYGKRAAVIAMRRALDTRLDRSVKDARAATADEVHGRLAAAFDERAAKLAKAAVKLPAGTSALNPQTVLAADQRPAWMTASSLLDELLIIADGIAAPVVRAGGQPVRGAAVALVATIPKTTTTRRNALTMTEINARDEIKRNKITKTITEQFANDRRLALVDVSRGTYGDDVRLAFPASRAELTERLARIATAFETVTVRGGSAPDAA